MPTDKADRAAKPEPGNRYKRLADQGGLYLFCNDDATRSWRYDYRLAGKRKTYCIGTYPEVSLSDAREHHGNARKLTSHRPIELICPCDAHILDCEWTRAPGASEARVDHRRVSQGSRGENDIASKDWRSRKVDLRCAV
jgi:hypothetical protein